MADSGLVAGMATAVGSLPHRDPEAAAALVLRCLPDLPAAPELPRRSPREGIVAAWAGAAAGVDVRDDGTIDVTATVDRDAPVMPAFTADAHGGLLAFVNAASNGIAEPPKFVKAQTAGPLTLGVAYAKAGIPRDVAFPLAARVACAWSDALYGLLHEALPDAGIVLMFDEPALVLWRTPDAPLEHEDATDLLSATLAACAARSGVHVCGAGDVRLALDAGPNIVHLDLAAVDMGDAVAYARFLDGDGWIAWGAIPTDGPVGEEAQPLWSALVDTWCELTRRGCDPARLRTQALVAPACGLAGHGESQSERAMRHAYEIGQRVQHHVVASKLAVGA